MSSPRTRFGLLALLLSLPLAGQCTPTWQSGGPQPQLTGYGRCTALWDPDGAGPLPQRLVVGGFNLLGGAQLIGGIQPVTQRVMTWDGSTWEPIGGGPGGSGFATVEALNVFNGELIAGGDFTIAGGPNYLARWDGTAWRPLGGGFPTAVRALATWNGSLYAAGYTVSGTNATPILRRWDGVTWTALPSPPSLGAPAAMTVFEGELIVAGSMSMAITTPGVLERWNGSSWAASILAQSDIWSLSVRTSLAFGGSDTLIVGGSFSSIGGANVAYVARTNGAPSFAWSAVGSGLTTSVLSLHVENIGLTDYAVVATGGSSTPVKRYTTTSGVWTPLGNTPLTAVTRYAGSYHGVVMSNGQLACHRYDGSQWVPVEGPGILGAVHAATRSGADMIVGGTFATISGVTMNHVARWDGSAFTPLGSGITGTSVDALATLDNGDVVAGGSFVAAGGTPATNIARWNGTTWLPMGTGMDLPVRALCKLPNGDLVAGGEFTTAGGVGCSRVARWNGTAWAPMDLGMNDAVLALVLKSDGTLFAGGRFTIASTFSRYHVAQWNGTTWGQVGAAMNNTVHGLAARPNGDIIAVGEFTQASLQNVDRIARWNGSSWLPMGAGSADPVIPRAVIALPNGDVIAGRGFHQPSALVDAGLSRWNGSTWSAISSLTGTTTAAHVDVRTIVPRADGALVIGGWFDVAGTTMSYSLAALQSTCMPSAVPYGAGCTSAAGPLVMTADTLPWLGTTFRTTTAGVAMGSLCLGILGFSQPSIPLGSLLPQGQPGCSLLTSPDIVTVLPTGVGTAQSAVALAATPSLLGVHFFQQTVPFEFDATGALIAIRSSNALAATIGTL